mgnify:CR=1 FL=1
MAGAAPLRRGLSLLLGWLFVSLAIVQAPALAQSIPDDGKFMASFPSGDPPGRVGRLSFVSNAVSLRGYGDEQWSPASINYPITTGTAVWTEPDALAEIRVGDAAIRLNNGTEVEFVALDDQRVHAFVKQGGVNVQIRSLASGDRFEISTPRGTATLSGRGYYRIDAGSETEPTRIAVLADGSASVSGDGPRVTVRQGEMALLAGADRVRIDLRSAEPDSFDRWAMARDPLGRPVQSARYVPAEMTGYEDLDAYGSWADEPDYGPIWIPRGVPVAWVPYRFGHWAFVWPWGWTWIDDSPWGFAPFHYGRWIFVRSRWCWFPGHFPHRPIFAPALVAFVRSGPSIGWFPLGPHDRYQPWFRSGQRYQDAVNTPPARPGTNAGGTTEHPHRPWVTVARQEDFARGRAVNLAEQSLRPRPELAAAPIVDLRQGALPQPQRDRVQRIVGTPPPVNLRAGSTPGLAPRQAAPATPSPRPAPFNQELFERFRDRNPSVFGTPQIGRAHV